MSGMIVTEEIRAEADAKVASLRSYGSFEVQRVTRDVGCCAYVLRQRLTTGGWVTLRMALCDWQEPTSDVVITNMTVLPEGARSCGHGGRVIGDLIRWARSVGFMREIRATQVSDERAKHFWESCGFQSVPNHPCGDRVYFLSPTT